MHYMSFVAVALALFIAVSKASPVALRARDQVVVTIILTKDGQRVQKQISGAGVTTSFSLDDTDERLELSVAEGFDCLITGNTPKEINLPNGGPLVLGSVNKATMRCAQESGPPASNSGEPSPKSSVSVVSTRTQPGPTARSI